MRKILTVLAGGALAAIMAAPPAQAQPAHVERHHHRQDRDRDRDRHRYDDEDDGGGSWGGGCRDGVVWRVLYLLW